jgi:hypothetical protein
MYDCIAGMNVKNNKCLQKEWSFACALQHSHCVTEDTTELTSQYNRNIYLPPFHLPFSDFLEDTKDCFDCSLL